MKTVSNYRTQVGTLWLVNLGSRKSIGTGTTSELVSWNTYLNITWIFQTKVMEHIYMSSCPGESQAIIKTSWLQLSFLVTVSAHFTQDWNESLSHHVQSWNPILLQAGTPYILPGLDESLPWNQSPILTLFYCFTKEDAAPGARYKMQEGFFLVS